MKEKSKLFIKQLFKEYYYLNAERISREVRRIAQRELAYVTFSNSGIIRHVSVKNQSEMINLLRETEILHLYHSAAYYLFPEREMEDKVWLASDLIFDIDADKLNLKSSTQSFKVCLNCKKLVKGETCEECMKKPLEVKWLSELELKAAKREALKLKEVLINEFGIKINQMKIYFSGSRGYHFHVYDEAISKLDSQDRIEIVDYLTLTGYDSRSEKNPERRTFKSMLKAILEMNPELVKRLNEKELSELTRVKKLVETNSYKLNILIPSMSKSLRMKVESYVKERESVKIDPVVTADIHRLIRFPESIHGGTGLIKREVEELEEFDPLNESVVLPSKEVKVYVIYSPRFVMRGEEFGPYMDEVVSLPAYAAAYLICKGVAEVA